MVDRSMKHTGFPGGLPKKGRPPKDWRKLLQEAEKAKSDDK
ncbi:hypothetical protein [Yersinia enterocolitica]